MTKRATTKNIYLIGPMGSGKTSIGKCLATLTGKVFYDSDQEIEKQTGVDIPWIFEVEGEAGFRKREETTIATLTQKRNIILSTGGGTIHSENNRQRLAATGTVIYLQTSIGVQLNRTSRKKDARPLLTGESPEKKLKALYQTRDPLYRKIADFVYNTDSLSPNELASEILNKIYENGNNNR